MESIVSAIIGVVFIIIGIFNRKGNISMLHSYHTKRVREEDKLPFGKLVGLGMIIIGVSLILMAILAFLSTLLQEKVYFIIGISTLIAGFLAGLGISFYAMFKYNNGIF